MEKGSFQDEWNAMSRSGPQTCRCGQVFSCKGNLKRHILLYTQSHIAEGLYTREEIAVLGDRAQPSAAPPSTPSGSLPAIFSTPPTAGPVVAPPSAAATRECDSDTGSWGKEGNTPLCDDDSRGLCEVEDSSSEGLASSDRGEGSSAGVDLNDEGGSYGWCGAGSDTDSQSSDRQEGRPREEEASAPFSPKTTTTDIGPLKPKLLVDFRMQEEERWAGMFEERYRPFKVDHTVTLFRKEAEGSPYYPFKNYTHSITILNGFAHHLSEAAMTEIVASQGALKNGPLEPECFVCRRRSAYLASCRLCHRDFHESCCNPALSGTVVSLRVLSVCSGCRVCGDVPCCDSRDEFTRDHLPSDLSHWRKKEGQYLPLLPVAHNKLPTYKRKGDKLTSTGKESEFSHIVLRAVVERDVKTATFLKKLQWQTFNSEEIKSDLDAYLPEAYITPVPVKPAKQELVRELNTGSIARECVCFGIHRLSVPVEGTREHLTVGDVVQHRSVATVDGVGIDLLKRGVIVAIFVDSDLDRLCVAVRPVISRGDAISEYDADPPPSVERCKCGACEQVWEVLEREEVVPVRDIVRKLSCCVGGASSEAPAASLHCVQVCGSYDADEGDWVPGEATGRASNDVNPDHLPVINLGLNAWGDAFQTFRRRAHSTTLYAFVYASLPFSMRMSRRFVQALCCTAPDVDEVTAFRVIFGSVKQLEDGIVMKAAPEVVGEQGEAFVRGGLFMVVADSPFQATVSSSLGTNGKLPCPIDYLGLESNAHSDKVGIGDPKLQRSGKEMKKCWESIVSDLQAEAITLDEATRQCKEHGLAPIAVQGEQPLLPNLMWDLQFFNLKKQLAVEWFHNIPEGHGSILYDMFRIFTPAAEELIRARWSDPYTWDSSAEYKGMEKFTLACHADILLRFFVDGSVEEKELWRMFRDVQPFGGGGRAVPAAGGTAGAEAAGETAEGQPRRKKPRVPQVPKLGLKWLAITIHGQLDWEDAKKMSSAEWRNLYESLPWKRFYTEYVVALSKLCRALSASHSSEDQHARLLRLADAYTAGARSILGVSFIQNKTLYHRLYHVIEQSKYYGGSPLNSSVAVFEASVQEPKRALTNNKENHMQMVESLNVQQAIHVLARGDPWEAVEMEDDNKSVLRTRVVRSGDKLRALLSKHYPKLDPFLSSVATVKDQGTTAAMQDDQVSSNLCVSSSLTSCRKIVEMERSHRPARVITADRDGQVQVLVQGGAVAVPSQATYETAAAAFPSLGFPPLHWYSESTFKAYRQLLVYGKGAAGEEEKRYELTSLDGWIKGTSAGGSHVEVVLGTGRAHYAEIALFVQPVDGGRVMARVLWFSPLLSRDGLHSHDPSSQYYLYRREPLDVPDLPPLIPVEAIKAHAHFIHACGHQSHVPRHCPVVNGVLDHSLAINNTFIKWQRPASKV